MVGVLGEGLGEGLAEVVDVAACGVEGGQQHECLAAHGLLDEFRLTQLWSLERGVDLGCAGVDAPLAAGAA
ncbi:hypothetical protein AB0F43_08515 [Kribbella sp. NPDC023972]|uniref:hypothetical protein n=1 Tax=Kribbella sp. NPDC023972 TaxID=3154795 RepID=UPI0033F6498C